MIYNVVFRIKCSCGHEFDHCLFSTAKRPETFVFVECEACGEKTTMKDCISIKDKD